MTTNSRNLLTKNDKLSSNSGNRIYLANFSIYINIYYTCNQIIRDSISTSFIRNPLKSDASFKTSNNQVYKSRKAPNNFPLSIFGTITLPSRQHSRYHCSTRTPWFIIEQKRFRSDSALLWLTPVAQNRYFRYHCRWKSHASKRTGGTTSACHNALYVKHQQVFPVPVATSLFTLSVSPPAFYRFHERAHKGQDVHGSLSLLSKDSIRRVYSFHRCSRHARGESIPDVSPCAAFVEARVRRFHLAPTNYPAAVFFRLLIKRHESVCARRRW